MLRNSRARGAAAGIGLLLAIAICLLLASTTGNRAIDSIQKLVTAGAIIVGGVWAYFKFAKGRTYNRRLEANVSGELIHRDGADYLAVLARLKNVGQSKVDIQPEGTALRISSHSIPGRTETVDPVEWDHLRTISVFDDHQWIESGEMIEDRQLLSIPNSNADALRIQLIVVSKPFTWKAHTIVWAHPDSSEVQAGGQR